MKYQLKFELDHSRIPIDYRRFIVSFFKKSLEEYEGGKYFDQFYGNGPIQKELTWSARLPGPKFKEETVELASNQFDVTMKIDDLQTAYVYFSSCLEMKRKPFHIGKENLLILKGIQMVREKEIIDNWAIFKILSPICLRKHDRDTNKDKYYTVEDEEFEEVFKEKLKEQMPTMKKAIDELEIAQSDLKMVIVQTLDLYIPGTIGTFALAGDRELLDFINRKGVGSRKSWGFGMIETLS